jgi:tetratricopeptide (TPR) repeat protein
MTSRTDRRALGLLAFLLGDTTLCHSAWSALDLRSEQDPLVDAAAGQLHHEAGRAALAYPRLQRAFDAFVDVGFLAYAIADCACELGDLDTAEHYLELAETLPLEDPWGRHRCVRANLLAARGDWDQAQEIYEELLRDTPASSTRRHYLRRLGQTGSSRDLERAVEIALEEVRFDAASPGSIRCLAEVADRWWSRLDLSARILEVRTALGEPVPAGSLLVQVRHTLKRSLGEKNLQNGTLPSGELASDLQSAPVGRESFLLEVLDMNWQTYPLQALPTAIQRLVARISVAADLLPRDARHEPGFALARGRLRPVVVGAALVAAMLQGTEAVGQKDWYQRDLSGPEPGGRLGNGLAYDSARGVMVMFGGWTVAAGYMNDTWEYDGCRWKNITTAHSPSPRRPDYSFAYDSSRGVIVTFGGQDDDTLGETWEYDGVDWVQRTPPTSPHDRSNSAMVYDEARDRMVLFGGLWSGIGGLGDTWEWDGATWTDVSDIIHPAPRRAHNMVYDSARGVTVLFGGYDGSTVFGDTWEWGGTSWQLRSPAQSPSIRVQPGLAYDPTIQRVVLSGGHYPSDIDDHWEWDGTHWIQQPYSVTTRGASLCAMDYDTRLQKVVLFGASSTNNFGVPGPMGGTVELFTPTAPQVTSFGSGCTGSQGNTPVLSITSGCDPVLCGSLSVSITNLVSAGAMAALMVDLPHLETGRPSMGAFGSSPWPYLCDLSITPDRIVLLNKSGGVATWSRAIPEDLVFIGERYLLQAGDIDPAAGGIALSNALDVRIGNE